jgi:hypothetical protein
VSADINIRGESLTDYLLSSNMNILNGGNEPNFVISDSMEVVDLTPGIIHTGKLLRDWHVSDDHSLSNHLLAFSNKEVTAGKIIFRDPKRIDSESYKDDKITLLVALLYKR